MPRTHEKKNDNEIIDLLRRAASTWFKNDDLLLLEELIYRYSHKPPSSKEQS